MSNPTYWLYRQMWGILDVIYPPQCGGCEHRGNVWCAECQRSLKLLRDSLCETCGSSIGSKCHHCSFCETLKPSFQNARSYAYYDGRLRNAVHRLKYHRDLSLGIIFSEMLLSLLPGLNFSFDLVLPVPLSQSRFKQRGYNQSALIAYPFALGCKKDYSSKVLWRVKDTLSQVNFSHAERIANVADAFDADQKSVQGKNILIIDDVYTTGATLNACTKALVAAGSRSVYCLTVARSQFST